MGHSDYVVSVGLPVRNAADRIERVVESVLNQDHENLELIISDNASTDGTEEVCRDFAARDRRVIYHRNPVDIGILGNFVFALRRGTGTFHRWVGDDDWLDPRCLSRSIEALISDDRLLLVTTQMSYIGADGIERTTPYDGRALNSDDPVTRFAEMLRLQNEKTILMDPLYGVMRRAPVLSIERRNVINEDQIFAAKLALAGPWGHVPEVLARRRCIHERLPDLARKLGVPPWQAHLATALQCMELLRWISKANFDSQQRRRARWAIAQMYVRRQRKIATHRSRKLSRIMAKQVTARWNRPVRITAAASGE